MKLVRLSKDEATKSVKCCSC